MPLFEYICSSCGHAFEALVRGGEAPACPECGCRELQRVPSLFAVDSPTTRRSALNAGRRRQTKIQRDRDVAEQEERDHHHD
jgi:putative FmdB family regulatory protein